MLILIIGALVITFIILMYLINLSEEENSVTSYQSTGSASAMSSESESGIKTVDDIACCEEMSKECLACKENITVDEFCKENSGKYGCCCDDPQKECFACKENITVEEFCKRPENNGKHGCCCHENIAECLACKENSKVSEFCAKPENNGKHGCCCHEENKVCLSCKQNVSVTRFCARDENKGKYGCCCNEPTKECLACQEGMKVIDFCQLHPGKYGCCCNRKHKTCLACQAGESVEKFCSRDENEGKFECPQRKCREGFFCLFDITTGYTLHAGCDLTECNNLINHTEFFQKNTYSGVDGMGINNVFLNVTEQHPVCRAPSARDGTVAGGYIGHKHIGQDGRRYVTRLNDFFKDTIVGPRFGSTLYGGYTGDPNDCDCFPHGSGLPIQDKDPRKKDCLRQNNLVYICRKRHGDKAKCDSLAKRLNEFIGRKPK